MRIADTTLLVGLFVVYQAFQLTFGGPLLSASPTIAGIPAGIALTLVAFFGILVGWVWIRRIARGDPEPEANDRHWLSRS